MSRILTIFGATGVQGGSVIKALLADPKISQEFKIRAITRDASKGSAQDLAKQGVEVVSADMNSVESLTKALQGTDTAFLVTLPDFVLGPDGGSELQHGKNAADAAKAAGVKCLVFSSLMNVTEASGGKLKHVIHFDRKDDIEKYIRSLDIPAIFIQPGYYMTNFTNLGLLRKGEDGTYTLAGPTNGAKAQLPLFYSEVDMGRYFVAVLKNKSKLWGKQIQAAADYYTPQRMVEEFTQVTGKKANYFQLDQDTYKSFLPPPIAQEILENELLCEEPGYFGGRSLTEGHELLKEAGLAPTTWKEFLESRKAQFD